MNVLCEINLAHGSSREFPEFVYGNVTSKEELGLVMDYQTS